MEQQQRPQFGKVTPEVLGSWVRGQQKGTMTIAPVEMGFFLLMSAPTIMLMGEPKAEDTDHNLLLQLWWMRMNMLPRDVRLIIQACVREQVGDLPPAPWEEVGPDGQPI